MNSTILQIPITKSFRDQVSGVVIEMGFSSLQDYLRLIMKKTLSKEIDVTVGPKPIILSARNAKRYDKMVDDVLKGRVKTKSFDNVDKMMEYLNSDNKI
ncbi:MAG: hypothetical protein ACD_19C00182G0047 [uncultured bacterium]|nr:MAG: hypothetical protein ACD_19C00182G0047 [uncultured bacterium]